MPLSKGRLATLRASVDEDSVHLIKPLETALYVEYEGKPVFHGPFLDPNFDGETGIVTAPAVQAENWIERAFWPFTTRVEEITLKFDSGDIQKLMNAYDTLWYVALLTRAHLEYDQYTDDPEIAEIYRQRIVPGTFEYPPDWNFDWPYDSSYPSYFWGILGESMIRPWQEVLGFEGGPEYDLEPLPPDEFYSMYPNFTPWRDLNMSAAWNRLNFAPRIGEDREDDVRFYFECGEANAKNLNYSPLGSSLVNREAVAGQTTVDGVQPLGLAEHPDSRNRFGTWANWKSTSFSTDAACTATAVLDVGAYNEPVDQFTVTPYLEWMRREGEDPHGVPPVFLEDYFVGDSIFAEGQYGSVKKEFIGRITQARITEVDADLNAQLDITSVPRVDVEGVI